MGRPPLGVKPTVVRLTDAVRQRITALVGSSGMAGFIREAVEAELARREKPARTAPASPKAKTRAGMDKP